ncbi:flagellar hook-length control protein FliK [Thermodesulfovibrionales bacterium]|nr:flagellar hook-length control protein FliK [Thermodesulfovibrionales bacterium]MCL0069026.1 flagellar hook-length control protein FliK [Thermodesulfovibrionales bacterium]
MINLKIANIESGSLTLERPLGKAIPLKIGEIVRAEVMNILPSGSIALKIKGELITARSAQGVSLEKGASAFLKITGQSIESGKVGLQFMGYVDGNTATSSPGLKEVATSKLIQELVNSLSAKKTDNANLQNLIAELLKALPSDVNSMSKEVRTQLQTLLQLLQLSLKVTGQSIQSRLDAFVNQLPAEIRGHIVVENFKRDLMINIERLLDAPLKHALRDTGIALEAKLKTIAKLLQSQTDPDVSAIKNDLKAGLLQLKQLFRDLPVLKMDNAVKLIDVLVRDIETFQLLSRLTDSFYTFLPLNWKGLKGGEIAFREGSGDTKSIERSCKIELDLEKYGKLTIIIFMHNKEFFVSFKAEDPLLQTILNAHIDELSDVFIAKELNLKSVNILSINDTFTESLERLESSERIINIKA